MNAKQRRILLLALAVLAVLCALLFGVRSCSARQEAEAQAAAQTEKEANAVPTKAESFVSIAYDNSITNLSFARDEEGNWIWADTPEFPLDGSYLDELSTLITSLNPMQTITEGDELSAYGLDTPSATITATAEDGSETVLILGKALSDGSYYLKTDDADTVYVVSKDLHERISRGVYDMAILETFPALTEDTLRSVTIKGPKTTELSVSMSGEEAATWMLGGLEVSAQSNVASLKGELSALAFTACRDFQPSDKAVEVCGLTTPAVVLTADYKGEDGEASELVLSIGRDTPEGDGRYARINDSTTIYSLSSDSITTLLDIARNGLTVS